MTEPVLEVFPVAVGSYRHHDDLAVDDEVRKIGEFLADFGGELVPWDVPPDDRGGDAIGARLTTWSSTASGDTVLYWVGHGSSDRIRAALAHAASPQDIGEEGISPERIAAHVVKREYRQQRDDAWAMVVIDTCKSARFVELLNAEIDNRQGDRRLVLIGVSAEGSTTLGRFSAALRTVLTDTFRADHEIELWDLARQLKRNLPGSQVIPKNVDGSTLRRRVALPAGLTAPLDDVADIEAVLSDLPLDERRHFVPKAQGAELGEVSWYFEGRAVERRHVTAWLHEARAGMLVVTGPAGSGKSALLGQVLVRSQPRLRAVLERHGLITSAPDEKPVPEDVFDVIVHLTGLNAADVLDRVAAALRTAAPDRSVSLNDRVATLIAGMSQQRLTVLADALDEAAEPAVIARSVLRPLAEVSGVRVVVGTRRSTVEVPDRPSPDGDNLIHALGLAEGDRAILTIERDPAAIERYVHKRLLNAVRTGALDALPADIANASVTIAQSAHEFLFARLSVNEIIASPGLLTDGLASLVASDHRQLFARAVDRLTELHAANGPLLRALAFTQGRGLPIRDGVWADIATWTASGPAHVTDGDIAVLTRTAAPYLMLDSEHGQTVYRLAHNTFHQHFVGNDTDRDRAAQRAIVGGFIRTAGNRGELNPYVTTYLAAHVGATGDEGWQLLADHPDVLDRLDPRAVATHSVRTAFGRFRLPAEIAGVVGAQHVLSKALMTDRPGLRQLAMARHAAIVQPHTTTRSWSVIWAHMAQHPTHLTIQAHAGAVTRVVAVTTTNGRTLLASSGTDGSIRVWDPMSGVETTSPLVLSEHGRPTALTSLPTRHETLVVVAMSNGSVHLWNPLSGDARLAGRTSPSGAYVTAFATLPGAQGKTLLVVGTSDGSVRMWNPESNVASALVRGGAGGKFVHALAVVQGPLGLTVAIGQDGNSAVRMTHLGGGFGPDLLLDGHTLWVNAMAVSDRRDVLVTADGGGIIRMWDPLTGAESGPTLDVSDQDLGPVAFAGTEPDRAVLACGMSDGTIRFWRLVTSPRLVPEDLTPVVLTGHSGSVHALEPLPSASRGPVLLASGGADGTIRIWDTGPATEAVPGRRSLGMWSVVTLSGPDGSLWVAACGADGAVHFWDAYTGQPVHEPFSPGPGRVTGLASIDRRSFLAATVNGIFRCELPRGAVTFRKIMPGLGDILSLTSFVDGRGTPLLVVCGVERVLRFVDMSTGRLLRGRKPQGTAGETASALTSYPTPGGPTYLVIGNSAGGVRVVDPEAGDTVASFRTRHRDTIRALTVLPRSRGDNLLVVGCADGVIEMWNPMSGQLLATLPIGLFVTGVAAIDTTHVAVSTTEGVLAIRV